MYAKGQREVVVFGYALALAAMVCAVGYMLSSGGCGRTGAGTDATRSNGTSTAQQAQRAASLNGLAGQENRRAGESIERADEHAERAAEHNRRAQAELGDCQRLTQQIRADNQRAKRLLDELIGEHQTRQATDATR